ncbi:uncharacterized protein N7459_002808 [Penicillium hispanicum]|uniref:uncharacterized protein n=1 Tax=Penicillium hispanicum TaxID=1080232 RepID=UPI002540E052|nr:uncharacterized protein N7459_002808 [Penicillium hispanicum]KAJ5587043.1 hypothetical protein N7459_002808 [Penicillium hispanicum]
MNPSQMFRKARLHSSLFLHVCYLPKIQKMQSSAVPLWKAMEDGSELPIEEVDLYQYERSEDPEKLAMRCRKFNLQALLDRSIKATGNDGAKCIKLLKCVEGQFNKAFLLTLSNGCEIVARLPNPNAGPAFSTTASEVATRHSLREIIGIPIPRVYEWSADAANAVGAEYIIEEKATGQPLGRVWGNLSMATQLEIVNQIVDVEKKLASVSLRKHGCIYYESDLKSRSLIYEALNSIVESGSVSTTGLNDQLSSFVIGPSANPKFWEGERATKKLDRGPWNSIADYATAVGKNELEWAASHAKPRMNFHRSSEHPETPDDYISLLTRYMELIHHASALVCEQPNRISHPDLHLDNIFVDPETNRITCIIDWQLASASPPSLQRSYPPMLEISAKAETSERAHEETLLDFYYNAIKKADPLRRKILSDPTLTILTDLVSLVPGCWDREDLFSLRNALIVAVARWDEINHGGGPCPVHFTEEELLQHQNEMELIEGISTIMHQLQDEGLIPLGGMVRQEYYERAQELNTHFHREFVGLATNKHERELHAKVWPYQ